MYQYKAILKSSKVKIAEGHTMQEIENQIKHFKRQQKKGHHTRGDETIQIIHIHRNKLFGLRKAKETVVKEE